MLKATKIKETGKYIVEFPRGQYKINEDYIEVDGFKNKSIEVFSIDNIKRVTITTVTTHYENAVGETLSAEDYLDQKLKLQQKGRWEGDDMYDLVFDSLDDEYAYRKFLEVWTPIKKQKTQLSDPLPVQAIDVVLNTGNKHITPLFSVGGDPSLYRYNEDAAAKEVAEDVMLTLGMRYCDAECEETSKKKVWNYPNHGGLRFLVAFGTYPLNKSWDFSRQPYLVDTLEKLQQKYQSLKDELETILISKYKIHFGEYDEAQATKLIQKEIFEALPEIIGKLKAVVPHQRSRPSYNTVINRLKDLNDKVNSFLGKK